uniref:Glycoprotein 120 n=1 Tax=Loa loa TaxID=7209 RepID=A0A1I7VZH6_LOALO
EIECKEWISVNFVNVNVTNMQRTCTYWTYRERERNGHVENVDNGYVENVKAMDM